MRKQPKWQKVLHSVNCSAIKVCFRRRWPSRKHLGYTGPEFQLLLGLSCVILAGHLKYLSFFQCCIEPNCPSYLFFQPLLCSPVSYRQFVCSLHDICDLQLVVGGGLSLQPVLIFSHPESLPALVSVALSRESSQILSSTQPSYMLHPSMSVRHHYPSDLMLLHIEFTFCPFLASPHIFIS